MLGKIAVAAGYAKAPKATFMVRHPKAGVAAYAVAKTLGESRTARRVVGGLIGLGAASVAIPALVAFALMRRS